jgi:outer membrane protein assembly factor BamB
MKMKKIQLLICFLAASVLTCSELWSQDWPQFRGPGRDSKVTAFNPPALWPDSLVPAWKIKVGTGDASPVISNNRIYLHTRQEGDEVVLCIDPESGKTIWAYKYAATPVTGPAATHPGPRSTPAVAGGKIVTYGASGILLCLDAANGKLLWKRENSTNSWPQFFTSMSPLIVDGIVIAHTGTKDNGNILALDLKTGEEKWNHTGDGPSYASPSLMIIDGKKHIIVNTEKNLLSLDFKTGDLLWQIPTIPQQRFYNCTSPYIDGTKIYYTGQGTGTKCIEVVKEGEGFSVKELWSTTEAGTKWTTPVLVKGYLYAFADQRKIYCINASNGQKAWIDNATHSDFASIVDCGDLLIGLPQTGNLIIFKPDNSKYDEVKKIKVSDPPLYTFPLITGNRIYIKNAEHLILYKL